MCKTAAGNMAKQKQVQPVVQLHGTCTGSSQLVYLSSNFKGSVYNPFRKKHSNKYHHCSPWSHFTVLLFLYWACAAVLTLELHGFTTFPACALAHKGAKGHSCSEWHCLLPVSMPVPWLFIYCTLFTPTITTTFIGNDRPYRTPALHPSFMLPPVKGIRHAQLHVLLKDIRYTHTQYIA